MKFNKVKLKDIVEVGAGQSAPKNIDNNPSGLPFIRAGSLEKLLKTTNTDFLEKISMEQAEKNKLKTYGSGTIIFAKSGMSATLNRIYMLKEKSYVVSHLATLKPINIYPEYLLYALRYFSPTILIKDLAYPSISLKSIENHFIYAPEDYEDQRKIANLLSKIENLLQKRGKSIELLDSLIKSTFLDMFGDPVIDSKNWGRVSLDSFGKVVTGNTPPRGEKSFYDTDFIEWIKTDNLFEDRVYATNAKEYLSQQGLSVGRSVEKGSLLVTCIAGSVKSIGTASLVDRKVAFNQQINAIQPFEDVDSFFLYWMFKISKHYIQDKAGKGMKKIINKSAFQNILFPKPKYELQKKFGEIALKIENTKKIHENSLSELKQLFNSTSQKAFKGELELIDFEEKSNSLKIYGSLEERLKTQEPEFKNKMTKIIDIDGKDELFSESFSLMMGNKFGLVDEESIKIIEEFVQSDTFLRSDEKYKELTDLIIEKHPTPQFMKDMFKSDLEQQDEASIIENVVKKHSNSKVLISSLLNLICEKEQKRTVRQKSAELLASYNNLEDDVIEKIVNIIHDNVYDKEKIQIDEEYRLNTAFSFIDKADIYPKIYKAIYWILNETIDSLHSSREVFINFLKKEFKEKSESLAFDILIKSVANNSRRLTTYKWFLFEIFGKANEINSENIDNYDYKCLKEEVFSFIKKGKIVQKFNSETHEVNLFWNFKG